MIENELNKTDKNDISTTDENINKKKSVVDFSKTEFNQDEKRIIKKEVALIKEKYPHHIPI